MQSAYDLGGITNFFLADDTINEVDSKLELLGEVKRQLTFEPWLMSFARMDIIGAKPHQVDLLNECNLHGLYFGIESMNPAVTKTIRKGGKPEKNYELKELAWGQSYVRADVFIEDQPEGSENPVRLYQFISLHESGPILDKFFDL